MTLANTIVTELFIYFSSCKICIIIPLFQMVNILHHHQVRNHPHPHHLVRNHKRASDEDHHEVDADHDMPVKVTACLLVLNTFLI